MHELVPSIVTLLAGAGSVILNNWWRDRGEKKQRRRVCAQQAYSSCFLIYRSYFLMHRIEMFDTKQLDSSKEEEIVNYEKNKHLLEKYNATIAKTALDLFFVFGEHSAVHKQFKEMIGRRNGVLLQDENMPAVFSKIYFPLERQFLELLKTFY